MSHMRAPAPGPSWGFPPPAQPSIDALLVEWIGRVALWLAVALAAGALGYLIGRGGLW